MDAARAIQNRRFAGTDVACNGNMSPAVLQKICVLDEACTELMRQAFLRMNLTARSYDRILRVARTIADLDGAEEIGPGHLAEAIQYRRFRFS